MLGLSSHSLDYVHPVVNGTSGTVADAGPKDNMMGYLQYGSSWYISEGIIREEQTPEKEMEPQGQAAIETCVLS